MIQTKSSLKGKENSNLKTSSINYLGAADQSLAGQTSAWFAVVNPSRDSFQSRTRHDRKSFSPKALAVPRILRPKWSKYNYHAIANAC
jgi:hypothetical protein